MSAVAGAAARPAAAPSPRPSFPGAVRSELLKIGRQALTWLLLAGLVVVTGLVLISTLASGVARDTLQSSPGTFYFTYLTGVEQVFTTGAGIFLLVISSRLVAMEYGAGTIRIVLGRGTSRLGLLASQYVALALAGLLLLAAFAVVVTAVLLAVVLAWHGSLSPLSSLPAAAWTDTWLDVLVALVSIAVCILLGTAAAAVGRSVAFGVGAAMALFPADNFGTIVMYLASRLTHQDYWLQLTQYFLGPVMNHLPVALQTAAKTAHPVRSLFASPLVPVDATHCWVVIGVYATVFLAAAVLLTWRRDVLE